MRLPVAWCLLWAACICTSAAQPTMVHLLGEQPWDVDPRVFGRFFEHNGKDAYPGLYAQHLANGSFEAWYAGERGNRREVIFEVEPQEGVAYPWIASGGSAHDGGPNGERYQRFEGEIVQRVAIPHERTLDFDVHLYARGMGQLIVRIRRPDGSTAAQSIVQIAAEWSHHTLRLSLLNASAPPYRDSPFGVYDFVLAAENGADVDGVMLMSGDAVDGKYNPTTIDRLKEFNVTSMRWPGGNWASAYQWHDGVGPVAERPVRPNLAWGGLEPNYLGTNEFLTFCELTGMEPLINVAFNYEDIPPADAAAWVEYVNGDTTTAMGRLRADHGYPEAWNVRLWQIGNEVYGAYQIGHEPADEFARKYIEYYDAMKQADSTITILAAAPDPLYRDWNAEQWNETFFSIAKEHIEGVDIHRYVRGVTNPEARRRWNEREYLQTFAAFPYQYEAIIGVLREHAAEHGLDRLTVSIGEWNANPRVEDDWPRVDYSTMAHAAFVAGMYNTFLRQGDAVRYSYQRDNNLYFRPYHVDMRPINPGAYVLDLYSSMLRAGGWHAVDLRLEGPSYTARPAGNRQIAVDEVPYVDAAAAVAPSGDSTVVFLTNRDLYGQRRVVISVSNASSATMRMIDASDPFARQATWEGPTTFEIQDASLSIQRGRIEVALAPAAVARILIRK